MIKMKAVLSIFMLLLGSIFLNAQENGEHASNAELKTRIEQLEQTITWEGIVTYNS